MQTRKQLLSSLRCLLASSALAQSAWTASRDPEDPPGRRGRYGTSATLEAARNEFEAFHVVSPAAPRAPRASPSAADPLSGPDGGTIDDVRVYREGMYNVDTPSNIQGARRPWPDAMIPAVDEIDNSRATPSPSTSPRNEQQPVFVEYHVPQGAAAGWYTGTRARRRRASAPTCRSSSTCTRFALPSTSSLPSAYGMGWNDPCTAHYGGYSAVRRRRRRPGAEHQVHPLRARPSHHARPRSSTPVRSAQPTAATTGRRWDAQVRARCSTAA